MRVKRLNFSLTGKYHRQNGSPCQDYTYSKITDDTAIFAVADGAGSSSHSHIGSRIAANCFAHYAEKQFDLLFDEPEQFQKMLLYISQKIAFNAKKRNLPFQEFYSTLIGIAIRGSRFIAVHVGDGFLAAYNRSGIKLLSYGQRGEFANQTQFITENLNHKKIFTLTGELKLFNGFILATDGSEKFLYSKKKKSFSPLLFKIDRWIEDYSPNYLKKKLKGELQKVAFQFTDDDISLAVCRIDTSSPNKKGD